MQTMEIWMKQYQPFVMGGEVWQNIRCEVPVDGPHDLGRGYLGYLAADPDGGTLVVERTSHGVVGTDLEEVREDIRLGDPEGMGRQAGEGLKAFQRARPVLPEDFWGRMKEK